MTEAEEALKPCPFCGGDAEYERKGDRRQSTIVSCLDCGATLESGDEWSHWRSWNTRADAAENAALREKLAERDALLRKRHDCLLQFVTQLAHAPRKPCTWMQIREAASDLLTQIDALTGGDNAEG